MCALAVAAPDGTCLAAARGTVAGRIVGALRGAGGFGYDPLFQCDDLGLPEELLKLRHVTLSGDGEPTLSPHFSEAVQCTGIVLSKIDGTAKGGVVIPIRQQFQLPVKFIGVGEQADDLVPFVPETFVEAMFEGLQA